LSNEIGALNILVIRIIARFFQVASTAGAAEPGARRQWSLSPLLHLTNTLANVFRNIDDHAKTARINVDCLVPRFDCFLA